MTKQKAKRITTKITDGPEPNSVDIDIKWGNEVLVSVNLLGLLNHALVTDRIRVDFLRRSDKVLLRLLRANHDVQGWNTAEKFLP